MSLNPTLDNPSFLGHQDFSWWLGTVVNADDKDAKLGRVKVEIFGFHAKDTPPSELPWCMVMQPTTNPAVSGVNSANQLKPGSLVMGFFLDYPDCQQPVVMGTLFSEIKKDLRTWNSSKRRHNELWFDDSTRVETMHLLHNNLLHAEMQTMIKQQRHQ